MRLHIEMNNTLVREVDRLSGSRGRSQFIREAVQAAIERKIRWRSMRHARGTILDKGHIWDGDVGGWVRHERRRDRRRVG